MLNCFNNLKWPVKAFPQKKKVVKNYFVSQDAFYTF